MQTVRVPLPEDPKHPGVEQWAEIRAVPELNAGDGKAVRRVMRFHLAADRDEWDRTFSVGDVDTRIDALLARVISTWSYDLPTPAGDPESLDLIPPDAWEALKVAVQPHLEALDFNQPTPPTGGGGSSGSRIISGVIESPDTSQTSTSSK